jgi:phosphoribosyl 1,2-cyclic phosphodiesterase
MAVQFTVLASGSAGNASLLQVDGFGLLLDIGLGPRLLARRMALAGLTWEHVHAVLLTHTHSDHWRDTTLALLSRRRIPLYCHVEHHGALLAYGRSFDGHRAGGLVHGYSAGQDLLLAPGLRCLALPLRHDGGATFGFRIEASSDLFSQHCALAYVADLGSWDAELARALTDVDLLALEFNHDVDLEYASGRSPHLIRRVLSDHGHLSNVQAGALLRAVLRHSTPGSLRYLVQLHLSRECNLPSLATQVAEAALAEHGFTAELHTASQDRPSPTLVLGAAGTGSRPSYHRRAGGRPSRPERNPLQPALPGMED